MNVLIKKLKSNVVCGNNDMIIYVRTADGVNTEAHLCNVDTLNAKLIEIRNRVKLKN